MNLQWSSTYEQNDISTSFRKITAITCAAASCQADVAPASSGHVKENSSKVISLDFWKLKVCVCVTQVQY
jgi:hypothetical protein